MPNMIRGIHADTAIVNRHLPIRRSGSCPSDIKLRGQRPPYGHSPTGRSGPEPDPVAASIDQNPGAFAHYGVPLITAANTVIVLVKIANNGFMISVFNSAGRGYIRLRPITFCPSYTWIPVYQPPVAAGSFRTRLYYPGAGGTIYSIDSPAFQQPRSAGAVRSLRFGELPSQ